MNARSPLYEQHRALGARFVEFAGWEMPLQYSGITQEHLAVRNAAGLFDVSHMGEIEVGGETALATLQRLLTNDAAALRPDQAHYTLLCRADGGTIDDLLAYRLGEQRYLLCVNAANTQKDFAWMHTHAAPGTVVRDRSQDYALLAVQGPKATSIMVRVAGDHIADTPRYGCQRIPIADTDTLCSRTGYTGEDGWEIFCPWERAVAVWDAILRAGTPLGLVPAGLGARDTLRIEAGLPLYGHELDETITPIEARLGWAVRCEKAEFIGCEVLCTQKRYGVTRKLVALVLTEPGIPRQGYSIVKNQQRIGVVTSGCKSPVLGRGIGLGYVAGAEAKPGNSVQVEIRQRLVPATIVARPLVRRDV